MGDTWNWIEVVYRFGPIVLAFIGIFVLAIVCRIILEKSHPPYFEQIGQNLYIVHMYFPGKRQRGGRYHKFYFIRKGIGRISPKFTTGDVLVAVFYIGLFLAVVGYTVYLWNQHGGMSKLPDLEISLGLVLCAVTFPAMYAWRWIKAKRFLKKEIL